MAFVAGASNKPPRCKARTRGRACARVGWLMAGCTALILAASTGQAATVEAERVALLILRILAYNRALAGPADAPVCVAVAMATPQQQTAADATLVQVLQQAATKFRIVGRLVKIVVVEDPRPEALVRVLSSGSFAAVVVSPGLESVRWLTQVSQERSVLSYGMTEAAREAGVSISILAGEPGKRRPRVVVNMASVAREGIQLDAAFLGAVEVVR